jgi:secreted PhoX family phosphatase
MSEHKTHLRASELEDSGDVGINPTENATMGEIIAARFSRRDLLRGSLAVAAISATVGTHALAANEQPAKRAIAASFDFTEIEAGVDETHHVAEGYDAEVLLRWGDPIFADAPEFDPNAQTAEKQRRQFGYNTDYVGYIPLNGSSDRGLLVVNHEYTNEELMFPGVGIQDGKAAFAKMTRDLVDVEIAAHGGAVVEIRREPARPWQVVKTSAYNRRITADTPIEITGPAAGHERMSTSADTTGRRVLGMLNNCAGGVTPWGTWLSCEENFNGYFSGKLPDGHPRDRELQALRLGTPAYGWAKYYERFDLAKEPNEPNRFGWVVEIDPFDRPRAEEAHRRSAARSMRARPASRARTGATSSISATTSASTTSTSSSPRAASIRRTAPPIAISSTAARSTSPSTMRTAPAAGSRWCTARVRSRRPTVSTARPMC